MSAHGPTINLLPKSAFDVSTGGKVLRWALTAGRYIIVLTELVVILAFISRFKLDQDISNLSNSIEGKKNILVAMAKMEEDFRGTQFRLKSAGKMLTNQLQAGKELGGIVAQMPEEMLVSNLEVNKGEIKLTGQVLSEAGLGEFLRKLRTGGEWKSLDLVSVNSDTQQGVRFVLNTKK